MNKTILLYIKPAKYESLMFLVLDITDKDKQNLNVKEYSGNKYLYLPAKRIYDPLIKSKKYELIDYTYKNFTNKKREYINYIDEYFFKRILDKTEERQKDGIYGTCFNN